MGGVGRSDGGVMTSLLECCYKHYNNILYHLYHLLYHLQYFIIFFLTYRENINSDTGDKTRYRSQYYTGDMAVLFGCPICRSGAGVVDILSIT